MLNLPRYLLAIFLVPAAFAIATSTAAASAQTHSRTVSIYVAPSGSGPQLGTRTHPYRSLEAARNAARAVNARADVEVVLAGGTYTLDRTLTLTERDSGVTYRAAPGANPVISGGRRVTGWT